jgi:hypothetical protein
MIIHFLIFLLLIFFPLRVGPDINFGMGSEIKAGLVAEEGAEEGLVQDKPVPVDYQKKRNIDKLLNPRERVEEVTLWAEETIEPRNKKGPDLDIFGMGGGEAKDFKKSMPAFNYNAGFEGFQGSFNDYISLLRRLGLDVVFVIDSTGSMQWIIEETRAKMTKLMNVTKRLVPIARLGVVTYRDREEAYVTKKHPLTMNLKRIQAFLNSMEAKGGADPEEAVEEGLKVAIQEMRWRTNSKKVIILVGDAPPHKRDLGKALNLVKNFRSQGGFVSTIDTTHEANDQSFDRYNDKYIMKEFRAIAQMGHGEATTLAREGEIIRQLIILTFGSRWKEKLQEFIRYF